MCGIFGVIAADDSSIEPVVLERAVEKLFLLSESRGKEAAGIMAVSDNNILVYREPVPAHAFIRAARFRKMMQDITASRVKGMPFVAIGHSRLATNGLQTDNINNQPVIYRSSVGVHNGIVVNDDALWRKLRKKPNLKVDTEALLAWYDTAYRRGGIEYAARETYRAIRGSASVSILCEYEPAILLATNTGSLYTALFRKHRLFLFASERYILCRLIQSTFERITKTEPAPIRHLFPGKATVFNFESFTDREFDISKGKKRRMQSNRRYTISYSSASDFATNTGAVRLYSRVNSIHDIRKHNFNYKAIYGMRRCSRCILPETTPFISFDENGVCNYCHEHTPITYKGVGALRKLVKPFRSKNGEPDCLVAFSGGRDSSYGLHFLKKELGMNPVAYTYDWGMVTDLARQNEARMLGTLGIEHIIVSADITMKRDHIRKHILAWMKKPDLGMVPLFMEGDKQCEYYMDDLSRKTGIRLKFFCRGNELEKEEFKAGHCGVRNADPGGVIHNLSLRGKIQMAAYYGRQYLTNPAYINSSVFDTIFAYFSTYIQRHDYIFLWHYIPWDETKILTTLQQNYGWQPSKETGATWRTDDGTSAFYNYIYYAVQGFTENDSFRARQVREGILSRSRALMLVHEENKPRPEALKWYFDRVGLNGHEVLSCVDRIPTLYKSV